MGKTFNTGRLGNGLFADANGNVGIGTTSLVNYFTTTLTIDGSSSQGIVYRQSAVDKGYLYWSSDFMVLGANTGGIILKSADTERARITSSGRFGLGTTNPGYLMEISASSASVGVGLIINDTNGKSYSIRSDANNFILRDNTASVDRLVVSSSGKVGINTSTPDNTYQGLTIYGTNPSLRLKSSDTGSWNWIEFVNSSGTNNFSMGVSQSTPIFAIKAGAGLDSPNFTMSTSGNIGIGTSSPSATLQVMASAPYIEVKPNSGSRYIDIGNWDASTNFIEAGSGDLFIKTQTSNNLTFGTAASERLRIKNDGNVCINTTTSNGKLDVYRPPINSGFARSLVVQGTGYYPSLQFGTYDLYDGFIATAGNDLRILAGLDVYTEDHNIVFYTSRNSGQSGTGAQNYERIRINYNGEFLIGTTVASSADPVHRIGTNGGSTWARLMIQERQGTWISWNTGSTNYGTVYLNGSVVVYGGQSDYRLKENIVEMESGLDKVMKLRPVTFNWKRDGSYGEGFIAHELQEIIPLAVTGIKDGLNESGEPDWQNVDKSHIVPVLVKAIQELKTEIEILKNK